MDGRRFGCDLQLKGCHTSVKEALYSLLFLKFKHHSNSACKISKRKLSNIVTHFGDFTKLSPIEAIDRLNSDPPITTLKNNVLYGAQGYLIFLELRDLMVSDTLLAIGA